MNFNYTTGIPAAADNPSDDQPLMQTNNDSNSGIWNIDHFGFLNPLGGWHKNIRLPQISGNTDPTPVVSPANAGQLYTKTINGDLQLFYESSAGVVNQLTNGSGILTRVAVNFTVGAGFAITINNSFNVTSVTRSSAGTYLITFTNALSSAFYYTSISALPLVAGGPGSLGYIYSASPPTTTSVTVTFVNNAGAIQDTGTASVSISL